MNRVVVITGATSGFGLAEAEKFRDSGDTVIIASRNYDKVNQIVEKYGFADGFKLDVSNYGEWLSFHDSVISKYKRIDILVNNAGGGVHIAELGEQSESDIDRAVSLNLNSVIYGSRIFGETMKSQKSGIIINISSVCAKHSWSGWSVYAAAKAGVLNFTKSLYVELRPYGVKATCIMPGASGTGFQKNAGIGEVDQSLKPDDIANAVIYAANQPDGVVIEEMTVWGTSQDVQPL